MDDDERAFRAGFSRLVEWYRVEQTRLLWRAFWPALLLLPLGNLVVGLSMVRQIVHPSNAGIVTLLGVLVTACGPLWAISQLLRSIRRDLYVAIRVDGLCVREDPKHEERVYDWESVLDARYDDARRVIRVSLADQDEALVIRGPFSQLDLPELSQRIRDARRLAVWNRLVPRFSCDGLSE